MMGLRNYLKCSNWKKNTFKLLFFRDVVFFAGGLEIWPGYHQSIKVLMPGDLV